MFDNEITLEGYEYTNNVQGLFELIKKCSDEISMMRIFGDSDSDLEYRLEEVDKLKDYLEITHGITEKQIKRVLDSLDIRAEASLVVAEINSKISSIKKDISCWHETQLLKESISMGQRMHRIVPLAH